MPRRKNKHNAIPFSDKLIGSMLVVVVAIMPLVVRFARRELSPELVNLFGVTHQADVFSYWKGVFIGIPALVIALYWLSDLLTRGKMPDFKSFFKRIPVALSCVYLIFVIISTLLSNYTSTAWHGVYDRSEGALMWMAYFIVFFAAMFFVREAKYAKVLLYGLAFSSVLMGAIGVGQLFGRDFFETGVAEIMVIGFRGRIGSIFDIAHGTLFNPNTFGKYTAMISPVMLLAALTYDGKKYIRGLFLLAGVLMLLSAFGSGSLGGLAGSITAVGVLAVTLVCGLVYRLATKQEESPDAPKLLPKIAIGVAGVVAVLVLAIFVITPLNNRVVFLFNRLGVAMRAETVTGYDYVFEGDTMTVLRAGEKKYSVTVTAMDAPSTTWLIVRDGSGNEVPLLGRREGEPAAEYIYNIPGYGQVLVRRVGREALVVDGFILYLSESQLYGRWVNNTDLIDLSQPVPAWGFQGRETWGSNRGYIWSRSFPLMPRRFLIGSGPDTFMNVFPVYDLVGTARTFGNPYTIPDKAHNLFIQTWITTGGISAIALFLLFGHYLLVSFISIVKSKGEPLFSYGIRLGLLVGISGFIMASMATDSTIGSTGVFFVLLGMGYGLNAWAAQFTPQKSATQ